MAVHGELGHGFLEAVYCEALSLELAGRGIPFEREVRLPIRYRGILLETSYRADFVCYSPVLVELKAIKQLSSADEAQAINYLKATNLNRALLLNFGASSLQHKRLVFNLRKSASSADKNLINGATTPAIGYGARISIRIGPSARPWMNWST